MYILHCKVSFSFSNSGQTFCLNPHKYSYPSLWLPDVMLTFHGVIIIHHSSFQQILKFFLTFQNYRKQGHE